MRVFGVDPGLTRCGFGVVDGGTGRTVRPVAVDVVRTPADEDLSRRLLQLADAVEVWLDRYSPDVVAIERVFSQHNVRTAMGTAQAGGIVALAAARRDLPVEFHTPSEVKAAVTGSGRADKAQVTAMVTKVLGLKVAPRPADAADALALAICHLWRAPMKSRLEQAQARAAEIARNHRARLAGAAGGAGARAGTAARGGGAAARTGGATTRAVDPLITDKRTTTTSRARTAPVAGRTTPPATAPTSARAQAARTAPATSRVRATPAAEPVAAPPVAATAPASPPSGGSIAPPAAPPPAPPAAPPADLPSAALTARSADLPSAAAEPGGKSS